MRRRWVQPLERNWIVSRKPCHPGLVAYDCDKGAAVIERQRHTTTQQRHRPSERPDIRRRLVGRKRRWSRKSEQANPGSSRGQDTQQRRQGTCVKGDAGDAMQGRWNCSDGCDARRCGAVRAGSCLYKYWLREATGIAPPEANCLRRDEAYSRGSSSPFCWRWANGEEEVGGNPRAVGWAEKWAADRAPASEAPARPTPASAQRLLVGSGWVGSGLGSGLGGGLAAKWALTWFLV